MPYSIVLDLETTGINILSDRPVQVAYAVYSASGELLTSNSHILNPQMDISPGALKVHQIGLRTIEKEGKSLAWFAKIWMNLVWRYQPARLFGYNLINFDLPILQRLLIQFGEGKFRLPPFEGIVDVMFLAQRFFQTRKWPKLSEAMNRLNISYKEEDLHDALVDVKMTWAVYEALTRRENER